MTKVQEVETGSTESQEGQTKIQAPRVVATPDSDQDRIDLQKKNPEQLREQLVAQRKVRRLREESG